MTKQCTTRKRHVIAVIAFEYYLCASSFLSKSNKKTNAHMRTLSLDRAPVQDIYLHKIPVQNVSLQQSVCKTFVDKLWTSPNKIRVRYLDFWKSVCKMFVDKLCTRPRETYVCNKNPGQDLFRRLLVSTWTNPWWKGLHWCLYQNSWTDSRKDLVRSLCNISRPLCARSLSL